MLNLSSNDNILIDGTSNARDSLLFSDSSDGVLHTSLFNNNYRIDKEVLIKELVRNSIFSLKDNFSKDSLKVKLSTIRSLKSQNIKLKRQLCIHIKKNENDYFVELPQVELYAYGDDLESTIDEIKDELIDLCDVVFSEKEMNLSNKVKKWKKFLEQYIIYTYE